MTTPPTFERWSSGPVVGRFENAWRCLDCNRRTYDKDKHTAWFHRDKAEVKHDERHVCPLDGLYYSPALNYLWPCMDQWVPRTPSPSRSDTGR